MAINFFRVVLLATVAFFGYLYLSGDTLNRGVRAPVTPVASFCATAGQIAFTFDEGPTPMTGNVLKALAAANVKATFHVVTLYFNDVAVIAQLKAAYAQGHLIGLRFPTALNPTSMSDADIISTLNAGSKAIHDQIGVYPKFLRLPYGQYNDHIVSLAQAAGFVISEWNIDPADYTQGVAPATLTQKYTNTFANVEKGKGAYISLQHDIPNVYADGSAITQITSAAKNSGYTAVTLDVCLGQVKYNSNAPAPAPSGSGSGARTNGGTALESSGSIVALSALTFVAVFFAML